MKNRRCSRAPEAVSSTHKVEFGCSRCHLARLAVGCTQAGAAINCANYLLPVYINYGLCSVHLMTEGHNLGDGGGGGGGWVGGGEIWLCTGQHGTALVSDTQVGA